MPQKTKKKREARFIFFKTGPLELQEGVPGSKIQK
jgi:hypothetical protein